jgi:hypothetical protein
MKKFAFLILAALMMLTMVGCGKITMKKGADEYVGDDYIEVISDLKKLGFKNIETTEIDDLTSDCGTPDGAVSEVSIDGDSSFTEKTVFTKDANVMVTYHIVKKLSAPIDSDSLQDMEYTEIADLFVNAGFTKVQTEEIYDLDPDETTEAYRNEVMINDALLSENLTDIPFDADVKVICHYPFEKYDVKLTIDFVGNLLFSKYDVKITVDGEELVTLEHGEDWEGTLQLKKEQHIITFSKAGDSSVKGEVTLDVTSNTEAEYKISCSSDEVTVTTIYVDRDEVLAEDEAKVTCSRSDYLGINYKTVESELSGLGFTNIKTEPVYDIFFGITDEESIEDVSINGSNDFSRGDVFKKDVEIILSYHMPHEQDPEYIAEQQQEQEEESEDHYERPTFDFSNDEDEDDFDVTVAISTLELYGKTQYPYGFKLHQVTGCIAETLTDDTWFLKYKCTITNEYGTKTETTCEGRVKGPESNPTVTYFWVY